MTAKSRSGKATPGHSRRRSRPDIPEVGPREPCPCGSGKRYKACHGKHKRTIPEAAPVRPFEGLPGECDWVAMREIVPSATAPLRLTGDNAGRTVTLATVLPLAAAALVRRNGEVLLGLQTTGGSNDPGRDLGQAMEEALAAEPGTVVPATSSQSSGRRIQDLLDLSADFVVMVHDDFDFWVDEAEPLSADVAASLERANAMASPTARLASVEAAYWCRIGDREQVRWVLPQDEEPLLDALARLHAAEADGLGPDSRLLGTFRGYGLLVPVWDLADGTSADEVEEPARVFSQRLAEALSVTKPLTSQERRARSGLTNRQVTLR